MEDTVIEQVQDTVNPETKTGSEVETPTTVPNGGDGKVTEKSFEPYKVFSSKEDFDRHSAGILGNAKAKAEKELLGLLGLKPDEKDKLAKFKEAYDATLSESEKQAQNLETLNAEVQTLKNELAEKEAVILALTKMSGKGTDDVSKFVKMAKGLVDENTTMDVALSQVMEMFNQKEEPRSTVPSGKPINDSQKKPEENPFETGNITKQGNLIDSDRVKARQMYMAAYGRAPSW